jgi:hypothetical protein
MTAKKTSGVAGKKKPAANKKAPTKKPAAKKKSTVKRKPVTKKVALALTKNIDPLNGHINLEQREAAKKLKIAHLNFANRVLQGLDQTASYYAAYPDTEANYSSVRQLASRLASNPNVSHYIELMKKSAILASAYDREWKRSTLVELVERAMTLAPVVVAGAPLKGVVQFDPSNAIRGINELNRMDGDHAAEKHVITDETQGDRIRRMAAMDA